MALRLRANPSLLVTSDRGHREPNRVSDPQALHSSALRQRVDGGRANCPARRQVLHRKQPAIGFRSWYPIGTKTCGDRWIHWHRMDSTRLSPPLRFQRFASRQHAPTLNGLSKFRAHNRLVPGSNPGGPIAFCECSRGVGVRTRARTAVSCELRLP